MSNFSFWQGGGGGGVQVIAWLRINHVENMFPPPPLKITTSKASSRFQQCKITGRETNCLFHSNKSYVHKKLKLKLNKIYITLLIHREIEHTWRCCHKIKCQVIYCWRNGTLGSTLGVVYTMHKAMSICISEHVPTAREGVRGRPGLQSHLKPWSGCLIKQHYEAVSRRWEGAVQ